MNIDLQKLEHQSLINSSIQTCLDDSDYFDEMIYEQEIVDGIVIGSSEEDLKLLNFDELPLEIQSKINILCARMCHLNRELVVLFLLSWAVSPKNEKEFDINEFILKFYPECIKININGPEPEDYHFCGRWDLVDVCLDENEGYKVLNGGKQSKTFPVSHKRTQTNTNGHKE